MNFTYGSCGFIVGKFGWSNSKMDPNRIPKTGFPDPAEPAASWKLSWAGTKKQRPTTEKQYIAVRLGFSEGRKALTSVSGRGRSGCEGWRERKKKFPPPLSSLNQNGRPCFYLRPVRKDGKLELTEVRIDRRETLRAHREGGRLTLHLVSNDPCSDYIEEEEDLQSDSIEEEEKIQSDCNCIEEDEELEPDHSIVVDKCQSGKETELQLEEEEEEEKKDGKGIEENWGYGEGLRRCHELVMSHHRRIQHHHQHLHHVWRQQCVPTQ